MRRLATILLILMFALAACGGDDSEEETTAPDTEDTTTQTEDQEAEDTEDTQETDAQEAADDTDDSADAEVEVPGASDVELVTDLPESYQESDLTTTTVTNVFTEEDFTLSNFAGRTVLMQGMGLRNSEDAIPTLEAMQQIIIELGVEDYVYITFFPEVSDRATPVATFADENDFDWLFINGIQLGTALRREYDAVSANSGALPRFYIGPDGELSELETGPIEDVDAVIEQLRALSEGDGEAMPEGDDTDTAPEEDAEEATPEATEES